MTGTLQKKPFLNYKAQINNLKHKKLIIEDEITATSILEKNGYYGLINGCKDIFKDPKYFKRNVGVFIPTFLYYYAL